MENKKRNIAVLYICIGRYSVMWQEFYESAKKNLFNEENVHYYVFTDTEELLSLKYGDVTFIREKDYGWPGNTLYRFRMFTKIVDEIAKSDYTYFFNANACFVKPISEELIPRDGNNLIMAQHFKMQGLNPIEYTYDRNKKSKAYVPWGNGRDYVQACFIGGTGKEIAKMSTELAKNIEIDDNNGVIAKWHDESHVNHYIIDKKYTLLPYSYVYPEVLNLPVEINILMRNKERYADLGVLRYGKKSLARIAKEKAKNQWPKIQTCYHLALNKLGFNK